MRTPKNTPMTQAEMIEAAQQKRKTSKIYKAESLEVVDEAISDSIKNTLAEIRQASGKPKINLDDTATVKAIAESYLESCAVASCFPSMSSLAMAMGYTRRNLYHYMEKKPDTETGKFLIQLHDSISNIIAENSLRNNCNAIASIFLLKSLFGFKDTQTFELVQNTPMDTPSIDDMARRAGLLED